MTLTTLSLDDKYIAEDGRIFVTGTQALVRLPIMQRQIDRAAGLNTAGFVTGYRGSPLGTLDQAMQRAKKYVEAADIKFTPGLNEDLAATAILGTQQINLLEKANKDGVFAMWYGKGPGVDRSGDAFRHGNLAGSSPRGGVLLLAGDDHTCKSSTTSHQSEYAFVDAMVPVLNPAGVQEIIDFGLFGWALSRYSGSWAALKLIAETVDSSVSIDVHAARALYATPTDFEMPPEGLSIRWPDTPQEQERRLHLLKIPAVLAFARANRIDRVVLGGPQRRIGIVTTGKSYLDVMQALEELGLSPARAITLGLSIYKVGMTWPLEPEGLASFARGLEEILVVEEKRPLIEGQIKDLLFNMPADERPAVYGKHDPEGRLVLPSNDMLLPEQIARAIAARILARGEDAGLSRELARLESSDPAKSAVLAPLARTYYFCSGCPHNTSTTVPEGSRAHAGIGCHWMSQAMDRNTATYTHMGGEGANWIGQAPFVPTRHVFQNMGDGTYFHSGLLAIRAAIAAKVTMTYKILFNDAVAMTGGQTHDGALTPWSITQQVRAEGVERIAVVSDDIEKYQGVAQFAAHVTVHHRDDLDAVQRELREVPGVSVLVYDQTCAAEKRRRAKRTPPKAPEKRIIINELVCEGCGDCSKVSNCLSVTPVDTEFGRKRRIDQSSCNKDYSCVNGFCPSFVTVEGGKLRKSKPAAIEALLALDVPAPMPPVLDQAYNVLVTGVGGTGIVTIGAILAMAAHIEEKGCSTLDMTGLAQKGGPVTTHLRIASTPADLNAVRIATGRADLVLGGDMVVAAGKEALSLLSKDHTRVILNTEETITGAFIRNVDFRVPGRDLNALIQRLAGPSMVQVVDATRIATALLGDSIGTNLFLVGYAYQKGLLPVGEEAVLAAIKLNGAAVTMNSSAFRLGRLAAHDLAAVNGALTREDGALGHRKLSDTLEETTARRAAFLTDYQNAAYARRYLDAVKRIEIRERAVAGQTGALTMAVAKNLFKLMAYKDEYEVARLYAGAAFKAQIAETFEEMPKLSVHLAPPLLARKDSAGGHPRKRVFGGWMLRSFGVLARFKGLRGTALDIFGYTNERRMERQLIADYEALLERIVAGLTVDRLAAAVELAGVPDRIRGYGHVKAASVVTARQKWAALEQDFAAGGFKQAAE